MAEITMYTTTFCPFCVRAKALLSSKGVAWNEINLDEQPELREDMIKRADGRRTVPQIFVNGTGLGGFDDIAALDRDGRLDDILDLKGKEQTAVEHHRVIVLGSGPAGYTAAIYAARANLQPVVVSGNEPGGQLTTTTDVENYPGYPKGVQGPEMMAEFHRQAERFGTTFKTGNVREADLSRRPFRLTLDSGEVLSCAALIISTGASAKWLELESEQKFKNRGVSACASCDGFFFKQKPLAVIGGGDTALEEAL
ncbi:MAG: glutaredoxin 3, partial [Candidatus Lambdaproteobacteria bacterium]|nr:glutaredoxin 3 [Candidatus Lambdaproteobacteria bacterium]